MSISDERCPTCDGAGYTVLRGGRVVCPTCSTRTHDAGSELDVSDHASGRSPSRRRRFGMLFFAAAIFAGIVALLTSAPLTDFVAWLGFKK
jgi:hypothetical protein